MENEFALETTFEVEEGGTSRTCRAVFVEQYNIGISTGTIPEGGSGGTYSVEGGGQVGGWSGTAYQQEGISLQAYPPSGAIFLEWSDGGTQNPYQWVPQTYTSEFHANYKAHLASNVSGVLTANGRRRLAKQESGNNQTVLVYPSAGEIWGSVKSGSSGSFGNEVRISTGNGNNDLPSIIGRANKEHVVWRRDNGGGSYTIYYAQRNYGVWSAPTVAGTAYGIAPVPLVTLKADYGYPWNDPPMYVLYNKYSTLTC